MQNILISRDGKTRLDLLRYRMINTTGSGRYQVKHNNKLYLFINSDIAISFFMAIK